MTHHPGDAEQHEPHLDALRQAYHSARPPEVGGERDDAPAELRDVLRGFRRAWHDRPTAGHDPAGFLRATLRRRRGRRLRAAGLAALLLGAVALGLTATVDRGRTRPPDPDIAQRTRPLPTAAPEVLVATGERVEMRAGSVRLVLLQPR
jgi:hypothetical protein